MSVFLDNIMKNTLYPKTGKYEYIRKNMVKYFMRLVSFLKYFLFILHKTTVISIQRTSFR